MRRINLLGNRMTNRMLAMLTARIPGLYMITFQIAGYLTEFTDGRAEIKIDRDAATVGEALNQLWKAHVGLRDRVLTERGEVRPHVNVFVNNQVVRRDQVLQVPIEGETEICIMPAVSGGACDLLIYASI